MMLATAILDREVGNIIDGDLGEIEDIYIDASSGIVLFATLEHGGFLDIGDEDFPVPMTALTWNAAEAELMLPITEELLESFPAIENDWETTLEPGWREVSEFWRNSQFDTSFLEQANLNSVMRASDLVGYGVGAYNAAGIANVQDLIINLGNSKVQYAVLSFLDAGTYGIEHVIVPFSVFDPVAFGNELVFAEDFNMSLLYDAPRVVAGGFDGVDTLDPTWDDSFAGYWEEAGFGADAG
jgi:sporulation protein YlmC with PRC-barrel domain